MVVIESHPSYSKPNKIRLVAQSEPFMDVILKNLDEVMIGFYTSKAQIRFTPTLLKNFIKEEYGINFHIVEMNQLVIRDLRHRMIIGLDLTYSNQFKTTYVISPKIVKIANDRLLLALTEFWDNPKKVC